MVKKPGKITVVVPAYNEEKQIAAVLDVLTKVEIVDEIIVVNDGSRDKTSEIAKSYGVRVIDREGNGGKGAAMKTGIESTDADIIAFIDADLIGLKPEHIENLINPLINDPDVMMTVGKFSGGRLSTDLAQAIVPSISGQRVFRREFLKGLPDLEDAGFGVEIVITHHAKQNGFKVEEVLIPEVSQVMKEEKLGVVKGLKARLKMYGDIAKQMTHKKDGI